MSGSRGTVVDRRPAPGETAAAIAGAAATLLASLALLPVFTDQRWVPPAVAAVIGVVGSGLLLRRGVRALGELRPVLARLGQVLVPVGQLAALTTVLCARYAPDDSALGLLPTWTSLGRLATVLVDGTAEMQEQATPALPLAGLLALTTLLVGLVALVVDLLAVGARQAALAGTALAALYVVPVVTTTGAIGPAAVVGPAAGLALLLWADQHRRLARRGDSAGRPSWATGVRAGLRVGALAILAGLVLGSMVPTLQEGSFGSGLGRGTSGVSSTGSSLDPVVTLSGQLTQPEPQPLLEVESSVRDPGYLRAVTLDQYDTSAGWFMSNLDGEVSVGDRQELAPLPDGQPGRQITAQITAVGHADRFLPVPYAPQSVTVQEPERWRFDPTASTVFGRGASTAGLTWQVLAQEPVLSADQLQGARPLPGEDLRQQQLTALPPLDPSVTELVDRLTAGAKGPYERVRQIHGYLTDRGNGFLYSLSTRPGTSGNDLVDFLRLKRGYCEQYAGAMAVMVREAGVPARVALGYTPGTVQPDGSRLVTTDDAHAWVEVWFDGMGWVPFDPTPIGAARAVELPWAPRADQPTGSTDPRGEAQPSGAPAPSAAPREDRGGELPTSTAAPTVEEAGILPALLAVAGGVLAAAAVVATPAAIRLLQRRRRRSSGTAGALWDELSATAQDLGWAPEDSATPRQAAARWATIAAPGGAPSDPAAGAAFTRLARAEEAASYGPPGAAPAGPELAVALQTACASLAAAAGRRARLRARFWPASLVSGAAARLGERLRAAAAGGRRRAGAHSA